MWRNKKAPIQNGEKNMTEKEAKKELMRRALEINPTVHVGKEGLKDSVFSEIENQLKKNRLIKIKVLTDDPTEIGEEIANATKSVIVDIRGSVIILTDKRTWTSLSQKKF